MSQSRCACLAYRSALESLWVIDDVAAWLPTRNRLRRLASAPQHHLCDPAIAARLLSVTAEALLDGSDGTPAAPRDDPLLGLLLQSLVTLSVRVYAQVAEARVFHLRTHGGEREVDLIVQGPDGRIVALEVRLAATVDSSDIRHLRWLADSTGSELADAAVVTTGTEAYRRRDDIAVIPAALLGP